MADVNGDKKADIVGFGQFLVQVALSNGKKFLLEKQAWTDKFMPKSGWNTTDHVRVVADVNGDRNADIVGFGESTIQVALADPNNSKFGDHMQWSRLFTYVNGMWRTAKHVRAVADVNGDGNADIIGFGENAVLVALSDGEKEFIRDANSWEWSSDFAYSSSGGSWSTAKYDPNTLENSGTDNKNRHVRVVADVNGDGKADIVGFKEDAVYVSLADPNKKEFRSSSKWSTEFVTQKGSWNNSFVRAVVDVNGDGNADIVGFGESHIYVSLADPNNDKFEDSTIWKVGL